MQLKENQKPLNFIFIETEGFSMWPFLKPGERLVVKRISSEGLKIGDIILYQSNTQIVCHRLVKKVRNKEGYLLYARGDNNWRAGEWIDDKFLIGKVVYVLRKRRIINLGGKSVNFINRAIVLFGPLLGIASRGIKRVIPERFLNRNKPGGDKRNIEV